MDFITISPHPVGSMEPLLDYDIVLNVSDFLDPELEDFLLANGIKGYWLPLGEAYEMPLENIYAAMLILWRAERDNKKTLIHCIAGRNRSQMILDCYRYMVTNEYDEDSSMMLNVKDNQLPGIYRLEVFLQKCLEVFKYPEIADSAFIDYVKKETFGF